MSAGAALLLDDRQRAMLAEMGVRTWTPPAGPQPRDDTPAVVARPAAADAPVQRAAAPVPTAPAPERTLARASTDIDAMDWPALRDAVAGCRACGLCEGRRNTVFGVGDVQADWLIVGEAPGENEDLQGEPFVGQAGHLLDNMLRAMGLGREQNVFIANVLKCRPPGNRNPSPEEVAQCEPFLQQQIALLQPKIILAMGRFAVQSLLQTSEPIGKLRGRPHQYQGVPVVVTYHPAYLLRNLPDKAKAWADLCLAMALAKGH